jgi:hypothetical protein
VVGLAEDNELAIDSLFHGDAYFRFGILDE